MSMVKTIKIDGIDIQMKASAAVTRMYRTTFNRDIFVDLQELSKLNPENMTLIRESTSLESLENIAYIMAKAADPMISDDITEWLDQFGMFSIYEALIDIIELWGINTKTEASSQKK